MPLGHKQTRTVLLSQDKCHFGLKFGSLLMVYSFVFRKLTGNGYFYASETRKMIVIINSFAKWKRAFQIMFLALVMIASFLCCQVQESQIITLCVGQLSNQGISLVTRFLMRQIIKIQNILGFHKWRVDTFIVYGICQGRYSRAVKRDV